jgi:hypothetical protein
VREPQVSDLPAGAHLYLALFTGDVARYADATHVLREDGSALLVTEISFPPLTFSLTLGGPSGATVCDVTDLARRPTGEATGVRLRLPVDRSILPPFHRVVEDRLM